MTRVQKGETLLGVYDIKETLGEDAAYQWVKGVHRDSGKEVLLQILVPELSGDALPDLVRYFDALKGARRKGLAVPDEVASDARHPVILVYPKIQSEPLGDALRHAPKSALAWWKQSCEALHVLHNKRLVHGRVSPTSFVLAEDTVYLKDFGYAPLLSIGLPQVAESAGGFVAPEITARNEVTSAADVFAFGKTLAHWQPELGTTEWFRHATNPDPGLRFPHMRDAFQALEREWTLLNPPQPEAPPASAEQQPATRSDGSTSVKIEPKPSLQVRANPPEGGRVTGAGYYKREQMVDVEAIPNRGWEFERWDGDGRGEGCPLTVRMDANKTVCANFRKIDTRQFALEITVDPKEGGTVIGGGLHSAGSSVTILARPFSAAWRFDRWSGSVTTSSENPTSLVLDGNKSIVAHFKHRLGAIIGLKRTLSVTVAPSGAGTVTGGGDYPHGQSAKVAAKANADWRFHHWAGAISGAENPTSLMMNDDKSIVAHFTQVESVNVVAIAHPNHAGVVKGSGHYAKNDRVEITAKSHPGWRFDHWSDDLKGSTNPATLTLDSDKTVVAHFTKESSVEPPARNIWKRIKSTLVVSNEE